ncbi:hypothetical protein SLEP1_g59956, partial [Rubroshorea leprosula]
HERKLEFIESTWVVGVPPQPEQAAVERHFL